MYGIAQFPSLPIYRKDGENKFQKEEMSELECGFRLQYIEVGGKEAVPQESNLRLLLPLGSHVNYYPP